MIDAHHHFWRQADLPWLLGPEQPRIFGAYEPIRRDYPIEEYLNDINGHGITGSVYVQANWAPNWALDEARWVAAEAARVGWPMGIVAFADVTRRDFSRAIAKLAEIDGVKGIRHQLHWHDNLQFRFAPHANLCEDETVQANIAQLADHGFSFDLQVFANQMAGAVTLAKACPEVTFILQHVGMLEDRSKPGRAAWQKGLKALAACENVVCKLSGLGTFIHKNDPDHIADQVSVALSLFGPDRCLFGSNYPIEKIWTPFDDLWTATENAVPKKHRKAVFSETAARVYRLN